MYWNSSIASVLGNAPWDGGITKGELIDYVERSGASQYLIDDLRSLENHKRRYYSMEDILVDVPISDHDFGWYGDD